MRVSLQLDDDETVEQGGHGRNAYHPQRGRPESRNNGVNRHLPKLEAAEAKIADMGREREMILVTVEDLRRRLDAEQEERRALQRLAAPEKPKGFLARLWGRG